MIAPLSEVNAGLHQDDASESLRWIGCADAAQSNQLCFTVVGHGSDFETGLSSTQTDKRGRVNV